MLKNELPEDSYFVVGGVGDSQLWCNIQGILVGNGVRIGLEDMYYWDHKRDRLCSNLELLDRIRTITDSLGYEVASPSEVREMLMLSV